MAALVPRHWNFGCFGAAGGKSGCCTAKKIGIVMAVGLTVHVTVRLVQNYRKNRRQKQYKRDTVILHQFPRAKNTPNMSPYCMKLESYLRLAEIPYEVDTIDALGPNGKAPWITYNDISIPDSTLCINYLKREFKKDLNSKLSAGQLATAQAFQIMAEEHLIWCLALHRYVYDKNRAYLQLAAYSNWIPKALLGPIVSRIITKRARSQGLGMHTPEVVTDFARRDLKAISDYLGKNKFFFGPEPTEVDCCLFSLLAMVVWTAAGTPFEEWFNSEFINLKDYCSRMKELVYPDWDNLLAKP